VGTAWPAWRTGCQGVSADSLGAPTFNDTKASIPVAMAYRQGLVVARWIDVIVLEQIANEWRVWDIFVAAPWAFRTGRNLRSILSVG
jgi:hypothetical protein